MNKKQVIGLIGSLLVITGVFVPLVDLPLVGKISMFDLQKSMAIGVLIAGALGLVFAFLNKDKLQLLTSLTCFIMIASTSYNLTNRIGEFFSGSNQSVEDSMENLNAIVHLSFGIPMIAVGALFLFFAAVSKSKATA